MLFCFSCVTDAPKLKTQHIHIIGDSLAKDLGPLMLGLEMTRTVSCACLPGAGLLEIFDTLNNLTQLPDCLVILAGSIDVANNRQHIVFPHIKDIVEIWRKRCSVIVGSLPFSKNQPPTSQGNTLIKTVNFLIEKMCEPLQNVKYLDFNSIGSQHFKRRGVQLKSSGRRRISSLISQTVSNFS